MNDTPNLMQMVKDRICDLFDLIAVLAGLAALFLFASLIWGAAKDGAGGIGDIVAIIAPATVPNQLAQAMQRLLTR